MTVLQVRQVLGEPIKSFLRTPLSQHPCDAFHDFAVFVNYSKDGLVKAVELSAPESAILDGVDLIAIDYLRLRKRLSQIGPVLEEGGMVHSNIVGVAGYAPEAEKRRGGAKLQSVTAFTRGYFD